MPILKQWVDSFTNFLPLFSFMKDNPLYFFSSSIIYFAQKEHKKMKIFGAFKCLGQNSSNSSCRFWNDKSIPLQILHHSSFSWHITPLWILSSYFSYFGLKDPIIIPILYFNFMALRMGFLKVIYSGWVSMTTPNLYIGGRTISILI